MLRNHLPRRAVRRAGCSSKSQPGGADGGTLVFPTTFRQAGFQMVRACRAPGEHSALNGFTVWVNDDGRRDVR